MGIQTMLTVKCPHCTTALKLRQAPPAGKVKCPKCGKVVPVRSSAKPVPAGGSRQPLDPDDAGFDFASVNFPSASPTVAVSQFPVTGQRVEVYDGPIPGDPLEALAAEESALDAADAGGTRQPAKSKKKMSPLVVVGALAVTGLLVVGAVVAGVMMSGSGGGGAKAVDALAELKASTPAGYQAVGHYGCVALLPKGENTADLRSVIDCTMVQSAESGSVFFFGAMDGGTLEIDADQMKKKAARQLSGEILGGTPTTRNKYEGIKGKLDGSLFVPNMMVEIFHVDGRFVILGCAPASFEADPTVQMAVDRVLEQEEQDIFYKSFKVGPAPSGWLF
jgi:hypothetical protein